MSGKHLLRISLSGGQFRRSGYVYSAAVTPEQRAALRPWIAIASGGRQAIALPKGYRSPDHCAIVHHEDNSLMCAILGPESGIDIIIGICGRRAAGVLWRSLLELSGTAPRPRPAGPWLAVAHPSQGGQSAAWHDAFAQRLAWSYLTP